MSEQRALSQDEKRLAAALRMDGMSYQEIGEILGVSDNEQYIKEFLLKPIKCHRAKRFPNLNRWMYRNGLTQGALAEEYGCTQGHMSAMLRGLYEPSFKFIKWAVERTGMPFEVVFEEVGENHSKKV